MTSEQAIDWLESIKEQYIHGGDDGFDERRKMAIDIAVQALKDQEPIIPKETGLHIPMYLSFNYECECGGPMLFEQPACVKCGRKADWEKMKK